MFKLLKENLIFVSSSILLVGLFVGTSQFKKTPTPDPIIIEQAPLTLINKAPATDPVVITPVVVPQPPAENKTVISDNPTQPSFQLPQVPKNFGDDEEDEEENEREMEYD